MSMSWRNYLRARLKERKIILTEDEEKHLLQHIEEYCAEADKMCRDVDPYKAVDEIFDEMSEEEREKLTKGVIDKMKQKLEKGQKDEDQTESDDEPEESEEKSEDETEKEVTA